ncbi:hypothetical protein QV65_32310 [Rhodococcus erythropolis]|nr:hypothetical protein QV65_32310 [Rhodococcus erythropolis]
MADHSEETDRHHVRPDIADLYSLARLRGFNHAAATKVDRNVIRSVSLPVSEHKISWLCTVPRDLSANCELDLRRPRQFLACGLKHREAYQPEQS